MPADRHTADLASTLAAAHRCPLTASHAVTAFGHILAYALTLPDPTAAVERAAAWLRWGGLPTADRDSARWLVTALDGAALGWGWLGVYPDAVSRVVYPARDVGSRP